MCATDPGDGEAIRSESIQASDLASRKTQAGRTPNVDECGMFSHSEMSEDV